jgi:hypothetical protein
VLRVVSEVFALNIGLAVLAVGSIMTQSSAANILFLAFGGISVAFVLHRFSHQR